MMHLPLEPSRLRTEGEVQEESVAKTFPELVGPVNPQAQQAHKPQTQAI